MIKSRNFKRLWGKPWDYAYLLELEQYKIREMCHYTEKHKQHMDWELEVRKMQICIRLIDIILERDGYYTSWLHNCYGSVPHKQLPFPVYVNTRNYKRFLPLASLEELNTFMRTHFHGTLRQQKAMYLYNKIRAFKMFSWWS